MNRCLPIVHPLTLEGEDVVDRLAHGFNANFVASRVISLTDAIIGSTHPTKVKGIGHLSLLRPIWFIPATMPPSPWSNPFVTNSFPSTSSPALASPQPQAYIATPETVRDNAWYPDSGATHHLTHSPTSLTDSTPYKGPGKVYVGNGNALPVLSSGQSSLLTCSRPLYMRSLLFVPGITKNLLSVSKYTKDNQVMFEFLPTQCQVCDMHTREVLLKGSVQNGLYKLHLSNSAQSDSLTLAPQSDSLTSAPHCFSVSSNVPFDIWHCRLGHPCKTVLTKALHKGNICPNVNIVSFPCIACHLGKEHSQPFQKSLTEYTAPLQLVVADVWGPAPVNSNAFRYYVAFTDAYTRYTWVYFLKKKSDVVNVFPLFLKQAERVLSCKLKILQTDGGGEFQALKLYLSQQGIVHRLTCPYTSAQNGLVERKHRQIVELGLSMLAHASMPLTYWNDAFATAVYLLNRLPSQPLHSISPYEKLFNALPSYKFLRVFGCLCFPNLRPYNTHKLQYSSKLLVLSPATPLVNTSIQPPTSLPSIDSSPTPSIGPSPTSLHASNPIPSPSDSSHSPSPTSPPSVPTPCKTHAMVTRSKAGIFKPKVYMSIVPSSLENLPSDIHAAMSNASWQAAIHSELQALLRNNTWSLCPLLANRRAIGCKWLFKVKTKADGTVDRYKAHLVAKGFSQHAGVNFRETFSPMVRATTIRTILALSVMKGWPLRQVDVNNAFLNGELTEEIYMEQPPGFEEVSPNGQQLVCRLNKALYGLRQAPRAWFQTLRQYLVGQLGFHASKADPLLFIRATSGNLLLLMAYVDDIVITGSSVQEIDEVVQLLNMEFALKDMGPLSFFLEIAVQHTSQGLFLS
ncbi:hypothetical protein CXB51_029820 [Gossypium anomalum]|uniref:Integrase catalytic domain-containing protein n=1 Tax=Gossypium anomalum TaxID=47600 RepID=A0A8J6CQU1_9ROSI|nr:hypothetical protein CXB51_029820 [Gossypium anomalum]